ncbi:MAG: hypothetical protein HY064_16745 [Bacteroidetes bacterium]|nr:hypothetical protein [Bacteroidota bacterium]
MKNFILSALALLIGTCTFAQDTLVKKDGAVLPVYLFDSDSLMISYKGTDTTVNEVNVLQKKDLLLLKHRNGAVEIFFSNDTLITMNGAIVLCKVIEIAPEIITTFSYTGRVNETAALPSSEVFAIRFHDGSSELVDHSENKEEPVFTMDYYKMGQADAKKYFKTSGGAIIGEVVSGMCTYVYFLGLIPGIAISTHTPKNIHCAENPNDALLNTNEAYKAGFVDAAKRKKSKDCWIAYGCGVVVPIGLAVAILYTIDDGF